jgi:sRNA-binding protein
VPIAETKDNPATSTEKPAQSRTRSRKRIIRRDDLPAAKLSTTKPPPKPKKKPAPAPAPKKPAVSPSDIRLDNLNASLNAFEVWREYRPLVIGVEKEVFRHIARHSLSASKRVVQRLLRQHVQDERYQRNLLSGGGRYHMDGTAVSR